MKRSAEFIARRRQSIAWMLAWLECLGERRQVSILRTEYQLRGWLL